PALADNPLEASSRKAKKSAPTSLKQTGILIFSRGPRFAAPSSTPPMLVFTLAGVKQFLQGMSYGRKAESPDSLCVMRKPRKSGAIVAGVLLVLKPFFELVNWLSNIDWLNSVRGKVPS